MLFYTNNMFAYIRWAAFACQNLEVEVMLSPYKQELLLTVTILF